VHDWEAGQAQHRERVLEHRLATLEHESAEQLRRLQAKPPPRPKSLPEKIGREIRRIPRNLAKLLSRP
ncbi:MAG: hypothetical protein M3Z64_06585, partial [Verrucomicrobiota bacterium]|nr:hypothetical protein [Verrucomicrobiota bacterium]